MTHTPRDADADGGPAEPVLDVRDLRLAYPARRGAGTPPAVDGITLRIMPGEVLGVVGASGSGKSSLARVLAGLVPSGDEGAGVPRITGGDASVLGQGLRRMGRRARTRTTYGIGYVPQDAGTTLHPQLTASEAIAEPIFSRDRRFDSQVAARRVVTLLTALDLPPGTQDRYPHELSSGQRQRVALARALGPRLLIADEPTSGVDVMSRVAVLDLLRDLQSRGGFSALVVSHDLAVVERLTDRLAVLDRGTVVGYGAIDDVLADPTHPYVQGLAESRTAAEPAPAPDGGDPDPDVVLRSPEPPARVPHPRRPLA
ncbi:ABC transporter ATP-binding protein [Clavibacter michiganensis]|uniref:ABC transporter ATP-binding protein n=1 Tax=Clavibacter michiganensis TaxID=28447 RepID=UPI0026DB1CE6|nr:ABC transporter ATP-binding protein [Clavibacter michiganensis]MDO4019154.1 ABC transporter ATP-binding protein [Clavibacter michiganensis]MDO4049291.1 ABC transporter ATP-binding protein [Clavibacter michiganensis]